MSRVVRVIDSIVAASRHTEWVSLKFTDDGQIFNLETGCVDCGAAQMPAQCIHVVDGMIQFDAGIKTCRIPPLNMYNKIIGVFLSAAIPARDNGTIEEFDELLDEVLAAIYVIDSAVLKSGCGEIDGAKVNWSRCMGRAVDRSTIATMICWIKSYCAVETDNRDAHTIVREFLAAYVNAIAGGKCYSSVALVGSGVNIKVAPVQHAGDLPAMHAMACEALKLANAGRPWRLAGFGRECFVIAATIYPAIGQFWEQIKDE